MKSQKTWKLKEQWLMIGPKEETRESNYWRESNKEHNRCPICLWLTIWCHDDKHSDTTVYKFKP